MSRGCVLELATRHHFDANELLEAWGERAAIRQHLAGFSQPAAELWAVGDIERQYQIGLHCPWTRQSMLAGGMRTRPPEGPDAVPGSDRVNLLNGHQIEITVVSVGATPTYRVECVDCGLTPTDERERGELSKIERAVLEQIRS